MAAIGHLGDAVGDLGQIVDMRFGGRRLHAAMMAIAGLGFSNLLRSPELRTIQPPAATFVAPVRLLDRLHDFLRIDRADLLVVVKSFTAHLVVEQHESRCYRA